MNSGCCSCGSSDCCAAEPKRKIVTIDFLYLDLTVCERCQGTETNLDQAVNDVLPVLQAAGFDLQVNKVNITSEALAVTHRFISSPTIRVNGKDIDLNVQETTCKECGDLCGDQVDCRVWEYEGEVYSEPPVAMIINAIMKEIYRGDTETASSNPEPYGLPDNLKTFFRGIEEQ